MITVISTPEGLTLRGHGGLGPRGGDILCAAVSILTETLAACLPPEDVTLGDGYARFACRDPSHPALRYTLTGLRLLADAYPDHIQIRQTPPQRANPYNPPSSP